MSAAIIRGITALAEEFGSRVERVERGEHFKFFLDTPTGKQMMVCSVSASDHRAQQNIRKLLRQWGRKP